MADDNLFVLLTYGWRLNEILLNRGRFFCDKTLQSFK